MNNFSRPETWYERAKVVAKKQGISIKDLAKAVNVSPSTVGHYLTGRCDPPIERLISIAKKLGTSVTYLLEGNEEITENLKLKNRIIELEKQLEIEELKYQLEIEKLKNLIELKKQDTLALLTEVIDQNNGLASMSKHLKVDA